MLEGFKQESLNIALIAKKKGHIGHMKLQLLLTMNFWLCHTVPGLRQLQLLRESQNSIWQQKHPFPVAFRLCNSTYNIYIYIYI